MARKLLAVVTADENSCDIVQWAANLAGRLGCGWIAVYAGPSQPKGGSDDSQLAKALEIARELGAEVVTATARDVVPVILRIAAQRGVSDIAIGGVETGWLQPFFGEHLVPRLLKEATDLEIHVAPPRMRPKLSPPKNTWRWDRSPWQQYAAVVGVVSAVSAVSIVMSPWVGVHTTALVFLLVVVVMALFVGRGPTMLAAALSALCWDYFILPPVYAFAITHFEDAMLLAMYFVVALVLGQLTARIRDQESDERHREKKATALYLMIRELAEAPGVGAMLRSVVYHLGQALKSNVVILIQGSDGDLTVHPASEFPVEGVELDAARQAFKSGKSAGRGTEQRPAATAMYVPLKTTLGRTGVLGVRWPGRMPLTIHEQSLLDAFAQHAALSMERYRMQELSEKARTAAESERLSKTLLNSVSHEIRTPISAIKSAAFNLVELGDGNLNELQQSMIGEMLEAVERLDRLVGNVLDITRIESGLVKPRMALCDVQDLVHVAVKETRQRLVNHPLSTDVSANVPLVRMDFVLMQTVLTNLLSNAAFHTPPGTPIRLEAYSDDESLTLCVWDRGPGLPSDSLVRIFDKFYRAPNAPAGGTGLGLSLVKGFVEAHRGTVRAENQPGGGARFVVRLPVDRVLSHATL